MFTVLFWKDALERSISTGAQALIALFGADVIDVLHLDWQNGLTVAGSAALLSLLKAVAAGYVGGTISPASLVKDSQYQGRHEA